MSQSILAFREEGEEEILIELEEVYPEEIHEVYRGEDDPVIKIKRVTKTFQQALGSVRSIASEAMKAVKNIDQAPDEVTLEMGIKFNGEANVMITKLGGEAHFNLTIKWKNQP